MSRSFLHRLGNLFAEDSSGGEEHEDDKSRDSGHGVNTDRPVDKEEDDAFQRYGYATRIATTIAEHRSTDSLVIGVYARWGEGKTSMLHFVRSELRKRDIVAVDFNPWVYTEEQQMLLGFFRILADALHLESDQDRKQIGKLLGDYASVIGAVGSFKGASGFGDIAKFVSGKLMAATTEKVRKRVDKYLTESNKKVVVFIDDVDRLPAKEVQDLFRVVKLIADFQNTVYVLAFDDKLVARALDDVYSGGGMDYLEKIVQLPLRVPKARPSALKRYVLEQLEKAMRSVDIKLTEVEDHRFSEAFTQHILWQVKSPRFAARYINSVVFTVPLLKGEFNLVDLLIMEAVKVLDPILFDFIGDSGSLLTGNYDSPDARSDNPVSKQTRELVDEFLKERYPAQEQSKIRALLTWLFPQLNHVFGTAHVYEWDSRQRYEEKRIGSHRYLERYYTDSVPEDQISDVVFDRLVADISGHDYVHNTDELRQMLSQVDKISFLFRLIHMEETYTPKTLAALARNLCLLGTMFPSEKDTFFRIGDYYWMLARFIQNCIVMQEDEQHSLSVMSDVFERADRIDFAYEIRHSMLVRLNNDAYHMKINQDQIAKASEKLYARTRKDRTLEQIMDALQEASFREFLLIGSDLDEDKIKEEVKGMLEADDGMFIRLLHVFCSTIRSSSHPQPYKAGFNQTWYDLLRLVIPIDYMYQRSLKLYGQQNDTGANDERDPMTDNQLVAAFQKVHKDNITGEDRQSGNDEG